MRERRNAETQGNCIKISDEREECRQKRQGKCIKISDEKEEECRDMITDLSFLLGIRRRETINITFAVYNNYVILFVNFLLVQRVM